MIISGMGSNDLPLRDDQINRPIVRPAGKFVTELKIEAQATGRACPAATIQYPVVIASAIAKPIAFPIERNAGDEEELDRAQVHSILAAGGWFGDSGVSDPKLPQASYTEEFQPSGGHAGIHDRLPEPVEFPIKAARRNFIPHVAIESHSPGGLKAGQCQGAQTDGPAPPPDFLRRQRLAASQQAGSNVLFVAHHRLWAESGE